MDSKDEQRRRRRAEYSRRYRAEHSERIAEYKRVWRAEHAEQIAESKRAWRERNLEHDRARNRKYMHARAAKERIERERRERKRQYAHDRYHADIETSRASRREARVRQRAEDPEGYREGKKRRNDAWRASHRDHVNAKARAKRQRDPAAKQVAAQKYYDTHAEERRAYSRRYHRDNRDQQLAQQRRWRQREQRRLEAGLPVRRLHRLTPAERDAHAAAAAEFFSTRVIEPMRRRLRAELDGPTPPELLAAWKRECERYRAAHYASEHPETSSRERRRAQAEARRLAEEARLDTIGRAINDRLRISPRRREPDPAYLPQTTSPSTGPGMSL